MAFSTLVFITPSCSGGQTHLQSHYGNDSYFFMGLRSLENGNTTDAERLLKKSTKKSQTKLIKRRSFETYASLGTVQDRILRSTEYYKCFNDEESLSFLCSELVKNREYQKVLDLTQQIDVSKCSNQLSAAICRSKFEKNLDFQKQIYKWCTSVKFSKAHAQCINQIQNSAISSGRDFELPPEILMRLYVFEKKYLAAEEIAMEIFNNQEIAQKIFSIPEIVRDAGISFLYGSKNFLHGAYTMDSISAFTSQEGKFFANFYAGRLYSKCGYTDQARSRFKAAMNKASIDDHYDNALWYYLDSSLATGIEQGIAAVKQFKSTWKDPQYFDDFFDAFSVQLLENHMWTNYLLVAKEIKGFASNETTAKFSYVGGRLIEEGFIQLRDSEKLTKELFSTSLNDSSNIYYTLMAAKKLKLNDAELKKILFKPGDKISNSRNTDLEKLILGYADFGFIEKIYPEFQNDPNCLSMNNSIKLADFLRKNGKATNDYFANSLRIAAKKYNYCETTKNIQLAELNFPRNFSSEVTFACNQFNVPEYLLYSLIRSESYFNSSVKSVKGANGLTQLMRATASDIARKLHIDDYDLNDPRINVLFGCYYFEELRRRLNGSTIDAYFSYNGGISRVRNWIKSSQIEFNRDNLAKDLFLEALPFEETREYGRKVISAAAMYGLLYYNKSTAEVIDEILQTNY